MCEREFFLREREKKVLVRESGRNKFQRERERERRNKILVKESEKSSCVCM